jgi:hypothetical protein
LDERLASDQYGVGRRLLTSRGSYDGSVGKGRDRGVLTDEEGLVESEAFEVSEFFLDVPGEAAA